MIAIRPASITSNGWARITPPSFRARALASSALATET